MFYIASMSIWKIVRLEVSLFFSHVQFYFSHKCFLVRLCNGMSTTKSVWMETIHCHAMQIGILVKRDTFFAKSWKITLAYFSSDITVLSRCLVHFVWSMWLQEIYRSRWGTWHYKCLVALLALGREGKYKGSVTEHFSMKNVCDFIHLQQYFLYEYKQSKGKHHDFAW